MKQEADQTAGLLLKNSVGREISDIMLRPTLFMLMFSQVILKKTFKDRKEKYDPLEKLRKQLNMPKESHSLFRSDRNLHNGQIDIILQSITPKHLR